VSHTGLVVRRAHRKEEQAFMTATNSSWTALRNPAFRRLWIASVISGTCVAAHDNAATYLMDALSASPFLISFISTAASLPFFLFTLPAGVLADHVNRKSLLCVINLWLAVAAATLAILARKSHALIQSDALTAG
jgi:MFS family permease